MSEAKSVSIQVVSLATGPDDSHGYGSYVYNSRIASFNFS